MNGILVPFRGYAPPGMEGEKMYPSCNSRGKRCDPIRT